MYKALKHRFARYTAWILVLSSLVTFTPIDVFAMKPIQVQDPQCKPGQTQKLTKKQLKQIQANAVNIKPKLDVRALTTTEMKGIRGSGPHRNAGYSGVMPWQKSFHDVNTSNGNLFKSFTDIQVAPARGAGLVLQRTYNSNDDRVGPFGVGWTHAYDTRMEEVSNGGDKVNNTDFFGAKHQYTRDADGLYTPPLYSRSVMSSEYTNVLEYGVPKVSSDKLVGLDGTVKHYIADGADRVCDYIEDRHGNRTTLEYAYNRPMSDGTTKNLLSEVTDPSGRTLTFTWSDLDPNTDPHDPIHIWRITHVDGPSYGVTYGYYTGTGNVDKDYNLATVTLDPGGLNRITSYDYTNCTGPNGTENGLLYSVTEYPNANESISYYYTYSVPAVGTGTIWVTQITEPTGQASLIWDISTYYYGGNLACRIQNTARSMCVEVISDPYLRQIYYATAEVENLVYSVVYNQDYTVSSKHTYHYSMYSGGLSNAAAMVDRCDNYTYGPHGHVLTHYVDRFPGTDSFVYYDVDKYFQKKTVTDMRNRVSTFDYGSETDTNLGNRGNMLYAWDATCPLARNTDLHYIYTYNQYGQKTSETNLNNVVTEYTYGDAYGNLTQVLQDPGTNHLNRTTNMVYDVSGRVVQKTDPNRRISTVDYNALGQPTEAFFPATNNTPPETVTYSYHNNGRLGSVTDNRGTTTIAYLIGCNRVASVNDPITGTIAYEYTLSGAVSKKILPDLSEWNYTYAASYGPNCVPSGDSDISEKLVSITDDQGRLVEFSIDATGFMRTAKFNQTFQNGTLMSYCLTEYTLETAASSSASRHFMHEIENTWHYKDGFGLWQVPPRNISTNTYVYDNVGNRTSNALLDWNQTTRIEEYGYDELYRLHTVNYGDGQTQTYEFDPMGNRTSKTDGQTETYVSNAANMTTSRNGQGYTYDANGNTLTGGGRTNVWDSQNRMYSCAYAGNTNVFTYGSDGLRRTSVTNGTRTDFAIDGTTVVREMRDINSDGNLESIATYFNGMYKRDDTNGTLRWYIYDGLGSVLAEVDPSGNVTAGRKYDVYGLVRSGQAGISKHKFVGQLGHPSEDETGLIYMRARYMDPVLGKFASEDPAHNGMNWYNYCKNNPINLVDMNGKNAEDAMLLFDEAISDLLLALSQEAMLKAYQELADALRDLAMETLAALDELGPVADALIELKGALNDMKTGAEIISMTRELSDLMQMRYMIWMTICTEE